MRVHLHFNMDVYGPFLTMQKFAGWIDMRYIMRMLLNFVDSMEIIICLIIKKLNEWNGTIRALFCGSLLEHTALVENAYTPLPGYSTHLY